MRLTVASDIHAPLNLDRFEGLLRETGEFDVLLLAGDVVNDNDNDRYEDVLGEVSHDAEVYAVFGNEEYEEQHDEYVRRYGDRVHFLDDVAVNLDGLQIVGTTGSLDRPTWWQRTNRPELWRVYAERVKTVDRLLSTCSRAVLLTHYAPTYSTLEGENPEDWPEMGRREFEDVIERHGDRLVAVVHGHAHRGKSSGEVTGVPIINAAVTLDRERLPVVEV
ncbi:MAG: 3',5'-cyclic adenosine monophosphate phosphodiesterase CpdA [Methanonatronarchaeales archaeon]|nr:3',5'-cyclic adenosine monophosphate phosphodiesterase CpdA [Methanonatronarchaeales archaeon]